MDPRIDTDRNAAPAEFTIDKNYKGHTEKAASIYRIQYYYNYTPYKLYKNRKALKTN